MVQAFFLCWNCQTGPWTIGASAEWSMAFVSCQVLLSLLDFIKVVPEKKSFWQMQNMEKIREEEVRTILRSECTF